nr:pyrroline-5-carboxylate reductase [Balneatrix alpica]
MVSQATLAFIGAGNMASAIIAGLVNNDYPAEFILATNRTPGKLHALKEQYGIRTGSDNLSAAREAQVVVLSVKPQIMREVASSLRAALSHKPLIISVAAGISLEALNHWLGEDLPIVRAMPNTPSQLGVGACGLYANPHASAVQKTLAERIMQAVGTTLWVDKEELIDAVIAVSGSGPAYFFLFMEAMVEAGVKLGLTQQQALDLAGQTALGAARMVQESGLPPAELRRRVTSPKGTTEQAILTFEQQGLRQLTLEAMRACATRAKTLAAELSHIPTSEEEHGK